MPLPSVELEPAVASGVPESLLRADANLDDLLQRLLNVVSQVSLPSPGHQAAWLAATSAAAPTGVFDEASAAMRRLLDAGTDVEDVL